MIDSTMNNKLLPVFQAAKATMTRITTKTMPPVVTSIGKEVAATSAKADRVNGGTTSTVISNTNISEAMAPAVVSSGTPSCRAIKVRIAVARPASTSRVPRIRRHQEDKKLRTADGESGISDLL